MDERGNKERAIPYELLALSHELKAPLAIISHIAGSMEQGLIDLTPTEQKAALQRIRLCAERTLRLAQGLAISQRLCQSDQQAFEFGLEPLNTTQLCQETIAEICPLAAAHAQTIQFHGSRPQLVVGNRELLRSVFFNLLDNAIKHNPPQTCVAVRVRSRQDTVRITVCDNGPGIKYSNLQRLQRTIGREFQPLRGRAGSSGLGLYIANQLALSMGGRLGVGHSQQGSDFFVDLLRSKQLSFW